MRDFPSCFGENGVQVADASCSSVSGNKTSQNSVTCLYKCRILGKSCLITIIWSKNLMGQCLSVEIDDASHNKCLCKVDVKPSLFSKRKGSKCLEVSTNKIEVCWDLSLAKFGSGPEPLECYYISIVCNKEMVLLVGDLKKEAFKKSNAIIASISSAIFVSKKEHISGKRVYGTKAQFSSNGQIHDVRIECDVSCNDDPCLVVRIDSKPGTAKDRAQVALLYKNADEKATNVSKFVHNLKKEYDTGTSTLCMIYNATGGDLTLVVGHNWDGHIWQSPCPQLIQNGQWAGFLHVRDIVWGPSKGAVVYRGTNNDGLSRDWVLAWNTPMMNYDNHVYTEILQSPAPLNWNAISDSMDPQGFSYSRDTLGCFSSVGIGSGSSPEFVGTMSLSGLGDNFKSMACNVSTISQSLDSKYVDVVDGKEGDATPVAE